MKKSKPFKIDLGLGNLYGELGLAQKKSSVKYTPTYTREKYAVYTNRDGVIIKHTFGKPNSARSFLEKSRGSGSYDSVSDVQFDY